MRYAILGTAFVFLASAQAQQPPREIPDPALTPGAVASTDQSEVCGEVGGQSYTERMRHTPQSLKDEVTRDYGQVPGQTGDAELDHDLPIALGGADARENLWWQPGHNWGVTWTYHDKDRLEDRLWQQVCRHGTMSLAEAQAVFLHEDWRAAYCREFVDDKRCQALQQKE